MSENLQKIIDRVKSGSYSPEDIRAIVSAIDTGRLVLSSGSGSVGIGGDVNSSPITTGDRNVIGNGNIVIYGADAQAIRSVLAIDRERQMTEILNASGGNQHRLEERRNTLQQEWDLRNKKINQIRTDLAIEAGTTIRFQLEQQLQNEEHILTRLDHELAQIEALRSSQNLNHADLQGQQLEIALTEEINGTGLLDTDRSLQSIQSRLQPTPDLFARGLCKGRLLSAKPDRYFVSHGFKSDLLADWRQALGESLAQSSGDLKALQPYFSGDTLLGGFRLCGICEQLYTSRFSLFLLPPSQDRNVYLEIGIAIGLGAPFFLIQHYDAKIPAVLESLSRYLKGGLFRKMRRELAGQIEEYDFGVVRFVANLPQAGSHSTYLVAGGESIEDEDFEGSIGDAMDSRYPDLEMVSLTNRLSGAENSGWVLDQLVESIQSSRFAIYRVDEESSASTFLALGLD